MYRERDILIIMTMNMIMIILVIIIIIQIIINVIAINSMHSRRLGRPPRAGAGTAADPTRPRLRRHASGFIAVFNY